MMMTCEEMLVLVQKDRPYQRISKVLDFKEITPNNYMVSVMMDMCVGDECKVVENNIIYPMLRPGTNVLNLPHYD